MSSSASHIPLATPPLLSPPPTVTSAEGKPRRAARRSKRALQPTSSERNHSGTQQYAHHDNSDTNTSDEGVTAQSQLGNETSSAGEAEAATQAAAASGETSHNGERETSEKEGEVVIEGDAEAEVKPATAPVGAGATAGLARDGEGEGEAEHDHLPSSSSSTSLLSQQLEGQPSSAPRSNSAAAHVSAQMPPPLLYGVSKPPPATASRPAHSASSSTPAPAAAPSSPAPDSAVWTRLSHLQLLLDQQLVSQTEYERRKQQLVDELTGTKLTPTVTHTSATSSLKKLSLTSAASSSSSSSPSSSSPAIRKRSHIAQQEREVDSIPLTSPSPTNSALSSPTSSSSQPSVVRHFPTHQSNNHLLMSSHSFLPRPPPDFSAVPEEEAVLHTFDIDTSSWSRETVRVRVERESFARGSLRVAYHMGGLADVEKRERRKVRAKEIEREKKRASKQRKHHPNAQLPPSSSSSSSSDLIDCASHTYVAKMSIDPYEERESYFQDVITQHYARAYAIRYNSYGPPKRVDIVLCWLLELKQRPGKPLCCVEVFVNGVYRKHNNNFGYVSEDERNTPQAFSHFSYEASQHSILIVDIQGVGDVWTDPQIHSRDGVGFGKGNMGERGVEKFIASHRCNAICRYLKLPNLGRSRREDRRRVVSAVDEMHEGEGEGEGDDMAGEEEGTMPAAQYMSYQSVDVMQIEIRGAQLDPFNADSPIPQHRRGMMASVSALILPPLIGGGKGRDASSAGAAGGKVVAKRDMKSPLILARGKSGAAGYSGGPTPTLSDADTVTPRCRWCCIL